MSQRSVPVTRRGLLVDVSTQEIVESQIPLIPVQRSTRLKFTPASCPFADCVHSESDFRRRTIVDMEAHLAWHEQLPIIRQYEREKLGGR